MLARRIISSALLFAAGAVCAHAQESLSDRIGPVSFSSDESFPRKAEGLSFPRRDAFQDVVPGVPEVRREITAEAKIMLWFSDWNLETRIATFTGNLKGAAYTGFALGVRGRIEDTMALVQVERHLGRISDNIAADVVTVGVGLDVLPTVVQSNPSMDHLDVWVGASWGRIHQSEVFGDFDDAIGFNFGATYITRLGERFRLGAELVYRLLEFDFDPDPFVVADDDGVGGSGVMGSLGLLYRF